MADDAGETTKGAARFLTPRLITAWTAVAAVAAYALAGPAEVIPCDRAERRRTLSQRTALVALSLVSTRDPADRERFKEELGRLAADLRAWSGREEDGRLADETLAVAEAAATLSAADDAGASIVHPSLQTITSGSTKLLAGFDRALPDEGTDGVGGPPGGGARRGRIAPLAAAVLVLVTGALGAAGSAARSRRAVARRPGPPGGRDVGGPADPYVPGPADPAAADLARVTEELRALASAVSHDLRSPLQQVASFAQLLARRYKGKLGEDADEFIGYIVAGVSNASKLIDSLLTLARVYTRPWSPGPVELGPLVEAAARAASAGPDGRGPDVSCAGLPVVRGDRAMLEQLFGELLTNAVKFARPGDRATIRVGCGPRDPSTGLVPVTVADEGPGFDPGLSEEVFKPFYRGPVPVKVQGAGVGLALCRKIAERHGGRISASSAPGAGTTITVSLPAV